MKKIYLVLIIVFCGLSGCEKDDICDAATPTTPRLVIDFYDISNPAVPKQVTNLKVIGTGIEEGIIFNPAAEDETRFLSNANKIMIPLQATLDNTQYSLILNSGDPVFEETDVLDFNYERNNVYVSRACGFKTLFTLNPATGTNDSGVILNNNPLLVSGNWIKNIEVIKSNLETENETHLKIYF